MLGLNFYHKFQLQAGMTSTSATSPVGRQKCFLCEVPRGPWAMLFDFAEPVCRACCNYEGIDKISDVVEKARMMRRAYDGSNSTDCNTDRGSRSPQRVEALYGITSPVRSVASNGNRSPTYAATFGGKPAPVMIAGPPGKPMVQPIPFPGITQAMLHSGGQIVVPTTAPMMTQAMIGGPIRAGIPAGFPILHKPVEPNPVKTAQRFAQIQETLTTLSKSPPFRVRFSKDHSLLGRVIAFDAVCRGSDYELKVFIEYPVGSGTVFQSASGAGRQMYGEFRERLGIGGGFRGASSNGYKDLEFERVFGVDEWKVMGELLTEEVRFFRGPVKKDLLPTPYTDPNFPNIPPATLSTTRGFLRNYQIRKRRSSNEEENGVDAKKSHLENGVGENNHASSPIDKSPAGSPHTNGVSSPAEMNGSTTTPSPHSPQEKKRTLEIMECLLCHKALDDSRFVQCPSSPKHKFCFTCSRDSIKNQSANSTDVYCPSSMKCLVQGSSTPWAFMEQEIATILESAS